MQPGPEMERGDRREHDRGEQHDGGVVAEYGGDEAGGGEDECQQRDRSAARAGSHPGTRRLKEAVTIAEVGEDEHRREEADRRREATCLCIGLAERQHAEHEQPAGGRNGDDRFRQPSWSDDGAPSVATKSRIARVSPTGLCTSARAYGVGTVREAASGQPRRGLRQCG